MLPPSLPRRYLFQTEYHPRRNLSRRLYRLCLSFQIVLGRSQTVSDKLGIAFEPFRTFLLKLGELSSDIFKHSVGQKTTRRTRDQKKVFFFQILCRHFQQMSAQNRGLGVLTLCRNSPEMSAQSRRILHFGKLPFPNLDFSRLCADISEKCLHRVEGRGGAFCDKTKSDLLVLKMHQSNF